MKRKKYEEIMGKVSSILKYDGEVLPKEEKLEISSIKATKKPETQGEEER